MNYTRKYYHIKYQHLNNLIFWNMVVILDILMILKYQYFQSIQYFITYKLKGDECWSLYYIFNALNEARELNNKVIVIGHIPLGVASYDCLEYKNLTLQDKIIKIFNDNNDIITFKLYSHDHRSEVKNINNIQLLTTPSISPIFCNNQWIRILKYNINKQILDDIQDYYIDYIYSTKNHLSK